jgi:hypothetical protein
MTRRSCGSAIAAVGLLATLAITGTAGAAGWAPPANLGATGENGLITSVGVDAAGRATALWYAQVPGTIFSFTEARSIAPDGTLGTAQPLSPRTTGASSCTSATSEPAARGAPLTPPRRPRDPFPRAA